MEKLLKLLSENNLTLGSVESLTGGLFASELTSIPGASKVYKGSLITYAIGEKVKLAHVHLDTIKEYSVVSEEVSIEMAKGGKEALDVDICVSVTGNAGPTTEPGGKPVGEVHISVAYLNKVIHEKLNLKGDRNHIRCMCVEEMKNLISQVALDEFKK